MRVAPCISLSEEERRQLERLSRGRSVAARVVERAKVILLAAEGRTNQEIAKALKTSRRTAGLWRHRFAETRLAGIEADAPRSGRRTSISEDVVREVVRKTTKEKPADATHWSTRSLAKVMGVSASTIRRIWKRHGLKPHRIRSFKLNTP